MKTVEVEGTASIVWSYPNIYETPDHLRLGLSHLRAADDLRISYSSERDGWVIEQASKFEWEDGEDLDEDWQEVAFVQAWAREKK